MEHLPSELVLRIASFLQPPDRLVLRCTTLWLHQNLANDSEITNLMKQSEFLCSISSQLALQRLSVQFPFVAWHFRCAALNESSACRSVYAYLNDCTLRRIRELPMVSLKATPKMGRLQVIHWDEASNLNSSRKPFARFVQNFGFQNCDDFISRLPEDNCRVFIGDGGWAFLVGSSLFFFGVCNLNEWQLN